VAVLPRLTVEEFDQFVDLPENADKLFEFIGGEIVEVPSNPRASEFGSNVIFAFKLHLREYKIAGHVTGEAGGYIVSEERYAPDAAYISKARQPRLVDKGYNPVPPELAVEVDFPSTYESQKGLRTKIANYLAAGTLLGVVLPETLEVEVYAPGQPVKKFGIDGVLDGGTVLPGFSMAVKDIFAEASE
jgi:Uma2 family endonuclease